jgi:N-acetylneuraminic acid mutarotase
MPEVRAAHLMKALNGKLYVLGGDGSSDPTSVWIYDPATDTWDSDSAAPMTSERDHVAGAVLDGKLYVMGGRWRHKGKFSITEVYDPLANSWTRLADMPVPRSGLTADVLNGKIHVIGGEDIDIFCTYSEHDVYDPATNTWERWPNLPTPRHGLASAVVGDRWYVIGGATSSGPFTQRTFTDAVDVWIPDQESSAG